MNNVRSRSLLVLLLVLTAGAPQSYAASADLVGRFFPVFLKVMPSGEQVDAEDLQSAFVIGDIDHSGHQLIVAVYTNSSNGAVVVISPESGGSVVSTLSVDDLCCSRPEVRLLDIDRDKRPEIVVTMHALRGGSGTRFYKWNGTSIALLPIEGTDDPDLADVTFLDIDGDGQIDVLDHQAWRTVTETDEQSCVSKRRLIKLENGTLKPKATVDFLEAFRRRRGVPETELVKISVENVDTPRQLIIINGDIDGANRVSSAVITFNDQTVIRENDLKLHAGRIDTPVSCMTENDLTVELRGEPGANIHVVLLPK